MLHILTLPFIQEGLTWMTFSRVLVPESGVESYSCSKTLLIKSKLELSSERCTCIVDPLATHQECSSAFAFKQKVLQYKTLVLTEGKNFRVLKGNQESTTALALTNGFIVSPFTLAGPSTQHRRRSISLSASNQPSRPSDSSSVPEQTL